ncbi:MAG TPA: hypothetical protein RMH85_35245 [Polyangiaceae bacterium LLY-WYZ-15_(1-7)]|nr:hypothetical protein [Polyangiaceae bacterium LLY-WYZ-15_(1-7)]HJL06582.1 hypothetical protein [Polyangiaceae bacterium LLY-WYZ-15_(1-7)]HJL13796.1 hypothetical protein [Polyangiaceae bacterium LLY-WYZ-15_(1-7)]HJL21061.1 hypothetical protein [Polyangiaceae bacterium LLY-WYZ-15_(1-7)]HJL27809.1 hypothetical protein [Polyangiaceae bacterium LLY-WYZ-15_(1-7)]
MSDKPRSKSLKERIRDTVDGFLEALDGLMNPEPELIPVRVRPRPMPPRRRRR